MPDALSPTELLTRARRLGASDVHIRAGHPVYVRCDGVLRPLPEGVPTAAQVAEWLTRWLPAPAHARLTAQGEGEAGVEAPPPVGRVRISACRAGGEAVVAIRLLPETVPTLDALGAPEAVRALVTRRDGLILICGAAGSGKTTTAAALIQALNQAGGRHIVTVEDPVEICHRALGGPVTQREVGRDTESLAAGLRAALRADPDVLLVGEIRDLETLLLAVRAAGTGHLVIATVHAGGAVAALDRVLDLAPGDRRAALREGLSGALAAIVHQRLIPANGGGRVAWYSVLLGTPAVRAALRDGQERQITALLDLGRSHGMISPQDSLDALRQAGRLAPNWTPS